MDDSELEEVGTEERLADMAQAMIYDPCDVEDAQEPWEVRDGEDR